jgi:hypothetical protein
MHELTQAEIAQVDGAAACQEACSAPHVFDCEAPRVYEFALLPCVDDRTLFNAQ